MEYPDIYYIPKWSELNAERDKGIPSYYHFKCKHGQIYYPFIKRIIEIKIDDQVYFDTITPYGFNGPIVIETTDRASLLDAFELDFTEYCIRNNIVAEYVRFSPWLKNHHDFESYYNLKYNNKTLYVDLEKDFFNQEFTSKCRNVVRKAQKNNILIDFDFDGKYIDEFYDLYNQMAIKNQIGSYYLFDKDYIDNTFETMRGNVFIARAVYDGVPMSSAMFLYNDKYLHYHLSGNNYEFTSFGGNSLILYEVSKWGQAHGIKQLHLGGAFEGGLLKFKSSFTKDGFLDFYVGMRIRDNKKYNLLVKLFGKNENGYFPEYRR